MGTTAKQYRPTVLLALVATAWVFSYSLDAQELKASQPNLELIVDSLDRAEEQNPALTRPYRVTRQYKVFRGDDPKPASEVTAQISFTPPDIKTFKITEAQGNPRGEKIVSGILEQEIASAKAGHKGTISRSNYDFVFLREQNFGRFQSTCCTSFQSVRKRACFLATSGWMPRPTTSSRLLESRSRVPLCGSRTSTSPSNSPPKQGNSASTSEHKER